MQLNLNSEKDYFTISELNRALNLVLEDSFSKVRFEGEIGELTFAKSGHLYFSLKDPTAQMSAVMWKGSVATLRFKPAIGNKVQCIGSPNIYSANGRLQMVVTSMKPAGEGLLIQKFRELKEKLEKEGLFNISRKREIPKYPLTVGVVTSATGAVIHDIMVRIKSRMPSIQVYLVDVKVQGEGAAKEIAEGIRILNKVNPKHESEKYGERIDVIIVGRGGGSIEDLWAFNEEEVVRAIFASSIPIISSVGHESDNSLSDLVADLRAPTPTAAAEMVSSVREELIARIEELAFRLDNKEKWFSLLEQRVDDLETRLFQSRDQFLSRLNLIVEKAFVRLSNIQPSNLINNLNDKINRLSTDLNKNLVNFLSQFEQKIKQLNRTLEALNPKQVLKRGYALVENQVGVISDSKQLELGDEFFVTFSKGKIEGIVNGKIK